MVISTQVPPDFSDARNQLLIAYLTVGLFKTAPAHRPPFSAFRLFEGYEPRKESPHPIEELNQIPKNTILRRFSRLPLSLPHLSPKV